MKEVPVYLFTGFLEAGKTKFIQETLEDERFNNGERTLLLLCEEGIEEYDPAAFSSGNVYIETIENEADLEPKALEKMLQGCKAQRVLVEYNGMWLLDTLYQKMPQNWVIAQEFLFCDANTFLPYNANMRQLVYDKLRSCELVVFNRCGPNIDRMALHKIVRAVSRRTDIAYEQPDGSVEYDEIEDPLPFDLEAPVVEIADRDYALFYSDLSDQMEKYEGKTLRYKGLVAKSARLPEDTFVFGRQMMACCANDIQFAGLICRWPEAKSLAKGSWIVITAQVSIKWHKGYGKRGPVLTVTQVEHCDKPEEPVAVFY
ncbi:MAG: TIGR03943 family protein [Oscillospiraceae bacterium]|nr:TIGR03943 family protein [Oscillospiraceae bacterium]